MKEYNQLALFYQQIDGNLWGAIHTVDGPLENQQASAAFLISKQIGGKEIIYGSVVNLLNKIVGLQHTLWHRLTNTDDKVPEPGLLRHGGEDLSKVSTGDLIQEYQEEMLEDTVLLTAMHFRNLNEIFKHRWSTKELPVYDSDDQSIGTVGMSTLANQLIHHRYLAVRAPYICDISSRDGELPSQMRFGSKIDGTEFLSAAMDIVREIRVRDFVGVLKRSISNISATSESRDIIFLVQNLHSLSQIIAERLGRGAAPAIQELLLRDVLRRDGRRLALEFAGRHVHPVSIEYRGGAPTIALGHDLSRKRIEIHVTINEELHTIEVDHREFFSLLMREHGDEPLVDVPILYRNRQESSPP